MTWTGVTIPQLDDPDRSGATSVPTVFQSVDDSIGEVRAKFPLGASSDWITWDSSAPLGAPRLVAGNANSTNSWTPTDGSTNPNLGSTGSSTGRYTIMGGTVIMRATHIFSGSGVSGGTGPFRQSLPVAASTVNYLSTVRAPVGSTGLIYDDSVAQATFGLGPTVYRQIAMHAAETITNDVLGLLNTAGLPVGNFQGNYFWNSHTARRGTSGSHLDVTTITLQQLAEVVATITDDLAALLTNNVAVDVANGAPITFAANDRVNLIAWYEAA